jgi:hypothetical protein
VVNEATKKYREPVAFALLAVGALWFIAVLSLLFKTDNFGLPGDLGFATRAAIVGGLFESPVPVLSLVVAVILVTALGGHTRNARIVVLAALGIGALDLLFGIITFFAQFGAHAGFGVSSIGPAGKVTGTFFGLGLLLFLAAAVAYMVFAFQSLPAPSAQPQWAPGQQGYGTGQPGWGQPGQGYGQPQQGGWGQQSSGPGWGAGPTGPAGAGWAGYPGQGQGGAPSGAGQSWGTATGQGWAEATAQSWHQQPGWGQQPSQQQTWGQQPGQQQGWGQPGQGHGGKQDAGQGRDWQWAPESNPAPPTWIQSAPTYGDSDASRSESATEPSWSQEEYSASGSEASWGGTSDETTVQPPDVPVAPVADGAYEGDDDTAAPVEPAQSGGEVAETPGGEPQAPADESGESGGGWWQPSQR